ncbi:cupin domain-containing protein [Clostridium sp. C8-1-8]|uniref:cupin domain-containing protein n=1 Tax=Clostridium sp. C8-1-8 TaxID=2698831 RepID=UPI00136F4DE7|nr:cupin domain-containing protein [Clostridium sp. C8-1-8]
MYNYNWSYPSPYFPNMPVYNPYNINYGYYMYPYYFYNVPPYNQYHPHHSYQRQFEQPNYEFFQDDFSYGYRSDMQQQVAAGGMNPGIALKDNGAQPFTININEATKQNNTFRTALWTGRHLQVTLMSINVGADIGLEIHPNVDQFLRIEQGQGIVKMGKTKDRLDYQAMVSDDFAIMIPAGTWHNVINTGSMPIKLYSIYAPPQHPKGTVHQTKADAEAAEKKKG